MQPPILQGEPNPQFTGGNYRPIDNNNQFGQRHPSNNQFGQQPPYFQDNIVQPPYNNRHHHNDSAINKIGSMQIIIFIAIIYGKF